MTSRLLFINLTVAAVCACALSGCLKETEEAPESEQTVKTVPVVIAHPRQMTFHQTLSVSGTVEAREEALVSARIPGVLDAVFVDEGDVVVGGETKLFQTDSIKLHKAVEIATRQLAVAECTVRERQANLERVIAGFNKSEIDFKRYQELFEKDQAVTRNELEQKESNFLQQQADVKHAHVMVELAERQLDQTKGQLVISGKDLSDSLVVAPISGVVRERFHEPGEMAGPGIPVLKIENMEELEICAGLPGEFYPSVRVGETVAYVHVNGIDLGVLPIAYKSPALHERLRTYEVKCRIKNAPEGVVAGGLAELRVVLAQRDGLGIPKESVLLRAGKDVVFAVRGDKVSKTPVSAGIVENGWVELLAPTLTESDQVVRMGQVLLDDGLPVAILDKPNGSGNGAAAKAHTEEEAQP